jgi:hypothetical protein
MKSLQFIRIFTVLFLLLLLNLFRPSLLRAQKEIPVEKFTKVSISLKAKVFIEQDDNYKLTIETDDKTFEKISIDNTSNELRIKSKNDCNIDESVIIHITAPILNGIYFAGSSGLLIEKPFVTDEMELKVSGSGSMDVNNLKADNVSASVSGSGSMNLDQLTTDKISATVSGSGKMAINDLKADRVSASVSGSGGILFKGNEAGDSEEFKISGSGKIDAIGFEIANSKVEISGSGNCKVFVSKNLYASITGSGNVTYKGNPVIESKTTGSGRVNHQE